jgi:hypothetical protein
MDERHSHRQWVALTNEEPRMTKTLFVTGMMLLTFSIVACSGDDETQSFNPQPDPPGATAPRGSDDSADASARRTFNPQPDPPGAVDSSSSSSSK